MTGERHALVRRAIAAVPAIAAQRALRGPRFRGWSFSTELTMHVFQEARSDDERRAQVAPYDWPAIRARSESLAAEHAQRRVERTPRRLRRSTLWEFAGRRGDRAFLLFLHGGGFTGGSTGQHAALVEGLAREARARTFSLDYRLAPEHPFPAALDDALDAFEYLRARDRDARIVVAGVSAGGGLALSLLLALRERGQLAGVAGAALLSPWADLRLEGPSLEVLRDSDFCSVSSLDAQRHAYAPGRFDDPLVSPALASLEGLPPLFVQAGGGEMLLDDANAIAVNAAKARVPCELDLWTDMPHAFMALAPFVPEGSDALARAGAWIRSRIEGPAVTWARGVALDVEQLGPEDGEATVLLHGFPSGPDGVRSLARGLADEGRRVLVPTLRGYGDGARPRAVSEYKKCALVADVLAVLDAHKIERATVVGHDWGGIIAWALALEHPERVRSMVVIDAPHPTAFAAHLRRFEQASKSAYIALFQWRFASEALLSRARYALLRRAAEHEWGGALPPSVEASLVSRWSSPGALSAMLGWYRAAWNHPEPPPRDPVVRTPVLIVWGDDDPALGVAMARDSLAFCERGAVFVVPRGGHAPHLRQPTLVLDAVVEFLRDRSQSRTLVRGGEP